MDQYTGRNSGFNATITIDISYLAFLCRSIGTCMHHIVEQLIILFAVKAVGKS